jgi:hypothetical protein
VLSSEQAEDSALQLLQLWFVAILFSLCCSLPTELSLQQFSSSQHVGSVKSTLQIPVDGYTVLKESTNGYLSKPNIQHGI